MNSYLDPGTSVLRNARGVRDAMDLAAWRYPEILHSSAEAKPEGGGVGYAPGANTKTFDGPTREEAVWKISTIRHLRF
jgi:hypothetical protein